MWYVPNVTCSRPSSLGTPQSSLLGPRPRMHTGSGAAHLLPAPAPCLVLAARTPLTVTTDPAGTSCLRNTSVRQKSPRVAGYKVHNRTVARL